MSIRPQPPTQVADPKSDGIHPPSGPVVLVHGFLSHRALLAPLGRRLRRIGYDRIRNWGYLSTSGRLEDIATQLRAELEHQGKDGGPVHVVTHSMGALLARLALAREPASAGFSVGRVVMIAPPSQGSPLARVCAPLLGWLLPALPRISDRADSFVHRVPVPAGLEAGVIAGRWDVLATPVACTHMEGQTDHTCIRGTHLSLPLQKNTARQVHSFLSAGRFIHDEPARKLPR